MTKEAYLQHSHRAKGTAPSLLTREQSEAMKGVYMLLIILAHNIFFTSLTQEQNVMSFFYMFHISGFFMLPFLYGSKGLSWRGLADNAVRLLWPFLIFTFVLYIGVWVVYKQNPFDLSDLGQIFLHPTSSTLRRFIGYQALWFLPAMFMAMVVHNLYFRFRTLIFILLAAIFAVKAIHLTNPQLLKGVNIAWLWVLPWGLGSVLPDLFKGVVARLILVHRRWQTVAVSVSAAVAIGFGVWYFATSTRWGLNKAFFYGEQFFPIAFMVILFYAAPRLSRVGWLKWIGRNSLQMYLIHPLVGFGLVFLIPGYASFATWVQVLLIAGSLAAIVGASVLGTIILKKTGPLYRFLFPHNLTQWLGIWNLKKMS